MRAAVFLGPRRIEIADRPDPVVAAPTDAVVRVVPNVVIAPFKFSDGTCPN